jgi:uracil-DNA glycosylase
MEDRMRGTSFDGAGAFVPAGKAGLAELARAVQDCRGCDLWERATQAVLGDGAPGAGLMLIGEQPGDAEDRQGKPFVGPAGRVLGQALEEAGVPADQAYITNAVKHFRWQADPRGGKRRLHQRPDSQQVRACRPWLDAEIVRVNPRLIVTLGATAGQALFGSSFTVGARRGSVVSWQPPGSVDELGVVPTVHPSAVLRATDRNAAYRGLVDDLQVAVRALAAAQPGGRG